MNPLDFKRTYIHETCFGLNFLEAKECELRQDYFCQKARYIVTKRNVQPQSVTADKFSNQILLCIRVTTHSARNYSV